MPDPYCELVFDRQGAEMAAVKTRQVYSYSLADKVQRQIPGLILDAMSRLGWNAFGIYEIVRDELKREKRERAKQRSTS